MALGDFDDELDERPHRDPLPLDDRLWRHPSELDEAAVTTPRPPRLGRLLARFARRA